MAKENNILSYADDIIAMILIEKRYCLCTTSRSDFIPLLPLLIFSTLYHCTVLVVGKYNWMDLTFMLKRNYVVEYHKCSVPNKKKKYQKNYKSVLLILQFHRGWDVQGLIWMGSNCCSNDFVLKPYKEWRSLRFRLNGSNTMNKVRSS